MNFIIFGLATWRIASLVVNEEGPFGIFMDIRELAGIKHDADNIPYMIPDGFLPQLLGCVWCASVWIGILFTVISLWQYGYLLALPFALSAVAVLMERVTQGR